MLGIQWRTKLARIPVLLELRVQPGGGSAGGGSRDLWSMPGDAVLYVVASLIGGDLIFLFLLFWKTGI